MSATIAKWAQTVRISWSNLLAYKLNLLLLVVGPMLVFFFAGIFGLGYLIWRLVTGRDGLWRRGPTRRRRDRQERRRSGASRRERHRPPDGNRGAGGAV